MHLQLQLLKGVWTGTWIRKAQWDTVECRIRNDRHHGQQKQDEPKGLMSVVLEISHLKLTFCIEAVISCDS